MRRATSSDGTRIAFSTVGSGPHAVLVLGAMNTRKSGSSLAKLLAPEFAVTSYDRRGRGSSEDTAPYAVAREVEDLEAVIEALGGDVYLYGHSSGAALALEVAARRRASVRKVAVYEAPYLTATPEIEAALTYDRDLRAALAQDDRETAVSLFMTHVGVPPKQIAALEHLPMWKGLVAMAPTLAYDSAVLGEGQRLPLDLARQVTSPALVMHGGRGADSMRLAAVELSRTMPDATLLRVDGQDHGVSPKVMAPILHDFFHGKRGDSAVHPSTRKEPPDHC